MGGMSDDSNPKDHLWSYDVENNKWKALPSMPTPRYASAAFEINNKLYVIGMHTCIQKNFFLVIIFLVAFSLKKNQIKIYNI